MAMGNIITAKTKCDQVVDKILSMISKGDYKEGEKLPPEAYFIDFFNVSRVTIRESFKKLNMLGVVTIKQGEGTFVNNSDLGVMMKPLFSTIIFSDLSVRQIYEARKFVESGMVRLATANRTETDLGELNTMLAEMETAVQNYDDDSFNRLDILFHKKIGEVSNNHILKSTYETIHDILTKYITTSNKSHETVVRSNIFHRDIVKAIQEQDELKAGQLMENHVDIVMNSLMEQFNGAVVK